MNYQEKVVRQALIRKGVSISQMCKDLEYTDVSLYKFFNTGSIRPRNKVKIMEYLNLTNEDFIETKPESKEINNKELTQSSGYSEFVTNLLNRIEEQAVEIFTLKRQLGKFRGTSLTLST